MLCLFSFLLAPFGLSHSHFLCNCRFQGYILSTDLKVTLVWVFLVFFLEGGAGFCLFVPEVTHSLTVVLP